MVRRRACGLPPRSASTTRCWACCSGTSRWTRVLPRAAACSARVAPPRPRAALGRAASHREDVYLDGRARWEPAVPQAIPVIALEPTVPSAEQSAALWTQAIERQRGVANPALVTRLASTFPSLGAAQIAAAVLHA